MAKKPNGTAAPEVIYHPDHPLHEDVRLVLAALDAGEAPERPPGEHGPSVIPPPLPLAYRVEAPEAATVRKPPNPDEVLAIRWHPSRPARAEWEPRIRFGRQRLGSHEAITARPFRAVLTARLRDELEMAFGRGDARYDREFEIEPVELEDAAKLYFPGPGMFSLYVKHRGLWLGASERFSTKGHERVEHHRPLPRADKIAMV